MMDTFETFDSLAHWSPFVSALTMRDLSEFSRSTVEQFVRNKYRASNIHCHQCLWHGYRIAFTGVNQWHRDDRYLIQFI